MKSTKRRIELLSFFNHTGISEHLEKMAAKGWMIEVYHKGDMVFVDETEYTGMKEVILSHDSEAMIYLVPAKVAADLDKYCWDFAANWVWHGPENSKFLKQFGDSHLGAVFGASDFIDYLNKWAFTFGRNVMQMNLQLLTKRLLCSL